MKQGHIAWSLIYIIIFFKLQQEQKFCKNIDLFYLPVFLEFFKLMNTPIIIPKMTTAPTIEWNIMKDAKLYYSKYFMLFSLINLNYVHHFISCEKYILAFECIINKSTTCIHFVYAYGRNVFIILIIFQEEILFTVRYACFIFNTEKII